MPASPSVLDPGLKCQRAKKHLDSLRSELDFFQQSNQYEISTEDDVQQGSYLIRIKHPSVLQAIPAVLIAGDFICCLRSSLDHLAWQLALLGGDWPSRATCFPICDKRTLETELQIVKSTYGMPDDAVAIVRSFQPYHVGENYRSTPLWRLHTLWNIDKHRHIYPFTVLPEWQFSAQGPGEASTEQADDCTIMRLPLALKEGVSFNPSRKVEVRFSDARAKIDVGYAELAEMYEFVTCVVFPAFAGFFP
jgi:hypothetical protein